MSLDWALLANSAESSQNGLVYILGGGIDTLWREQFPAPFGGALVLRVLTGRHEAERPHTVEVQCSDEDGHAVLQQPVIVTMPARTAHSDHPKGWDLAANIVINLAGVPIPKPGFYQFEIRIDGQAVRTLPFRAVPPERVDL